MSELASAVCSITITQRRRFFWAAWWTRPPREAPFAKPDASGGGFSTLEGALASAEICAARYLVLIEPYWARAWSRVMRGERPPPHPITRPVRPVRLVQRSAWDLLGLPAGASISEVKAAFRQRALVAHPDHGGEPDAFRALHAAYELLVAQIARGRRNRE